MSTNQKVVGVKVEKGVSFCFGHFRHGYRFGTINSSSTQDYQLNFGGIRCCHPDIAAMYIDGGKSFTLPEGWTIVFDRRNGEADISSFISCQLILPHGLRILQEGQGIPEEIGHLISGNLQLGEGFNFRNFKRYISMEKVKYLPFLITPVTFEFNVYFPTRERISAAIETFRRVLERIAILAPFLPQLVKEVYALVRLDEVRLIRASRYTSIAMEDVYARVNKQLIPFSNKFGYVYEEMEGSQDVTDFAEMNKEKQA